LADGIILEAFNILSNFPNLGDPNAKVFSDVATALLIADDNDADPVNGTPHQSTILEAFGADHHIYPDGYVISGHIKGNTTWLTDTYITGDVTVDNDATLTILPGTIIKFVSGTELKINGTLIAQGSSSAPIQFTSAGSSNWSGIKFENSSSGTLKYCEIDHATYGVYVKE